MLLLPDRRSSRSLPQPTWLIGWHKFLQDFTEGIAYCIWEEAGSPFISLAKIKISHHLFNDPDQQTKIIIASLHVNFCANSLNSNVNFWLSFLSHSTSKIPSNFGAIKFSQIYMHAIITTNPNIQYQKMLGFTWRHSCGWVQQMFLSSSRKYTFHKYRPTLDKTHLFCYYIVPGTVFFSVTWCFICLINNLIVLFILKILS